jgi:hypothetical protein
MGKWIPLVVTVLTTIGTAVLTPQFVVAHPLAFAILNAAAMVLHSVLPSTTATSPTVSK